VTEEELAASLGLPETAEMKALRSKILRLAPRGYDEGSREFTSTFGRYQQLGGAAVDSIATGPSDARMKAQIALILLSASVKRDISAVNGFYIAWWDEELCYARTYAARSLFDPDIATAIEQLRTTGPISRII
jgi:hypothetical protein